jgi:hypothetical protein
MLAIPARGMSLLFLLMAGGCAQLLGIEDLPELTDGGAGSIDADPSAPDASAISIDATPGNNCGWPFAPRHFDPCAPDNPTGLTLLVLGDDGTYVYNTDNTVLTDPLGVDIVPPSTLEQDGEVRALWVNGLEIETGSTLRVKGSRPLMIVSTGEILVRGIIDVSSTLDPVTQTFDPGAGADPPSAECASSTGQNGGDCESGGGGGGGGGFGGAGADGGRGARLNDCNGVIGISGGAGGIAVPAPEAIRGGCKGARGGNGDSDALYGLGGFGGGAAHLVSMVRIDIAGTVQSGGAAGSGGENNRSGGGGAGSGGFIGLEAIDIEIETTAVLAANGGGGGGGCSNGLAESGEDGLDSDLPASGGLAQSAGGAGGDGGARIERDGEPGGASDRGGGGGGGGAGFIVTYQANPAVDGAAVISPALTER